LGTGREVLVKNGVIKKAKAGAGKIYAQGVVPKKIRWEHWGKVTGDEVGQKGHNERDRWKKKG